MDESAQEGDAPQGVVHWSSIETGSELSATVVFAAGFALDPSKPVRETYCVQRKLGAGAMGQVLAVSLVGEQSQQAFALKLVARPRSSGRASIGGSMEKPTAQQDAATRWLTGLLRNEASKQEAAQRHGVTVARFVALVRLDDGALGLRMEMARGRSWGVLVEEENLRRDDPPDIYRAIRAARKLLGQLRRVHSIREPGAPSGFVHSDIKPTNVFVDDADPTDPSVTLLDFGVATAGRAAIEDEAAMIGRETFVLRQTGGTPGYAPPGHFNARPSPASDVHAAIVCFYELVALALPWDIDDIDPSPAGFAVMELRISAGPKPVRALRPAIFDAEAKALDRFFNSAFSDLQSRAMAWAGVASARDERSAERAQQLTDELSTLAGEYQRSLDALLRELESLGIPAPPAPPPSLVMVSQSMVAPSPVTADDPASAIDTAPTIVAAHKGEKRAWADTESEAPIALPLEKRSWRSAALGAVALAVVAAGALSLRALLAPSPTSSADAGAPSVDAHSDERADGTVVADALAPVVDPGVSLAVAPASPLDVRALPRAFRSSRSLASITAPIAQRDAGHDSGAASSGATVLCVASSRGVRVIARGGALDHEVILCSTDVVSDATTQEFAGRGTMDAEVLRALPTVQCSGEGRWLTAVRRFSSGGGAQTWLFTCTRPAPEPVEPTHAPDAAAVTVAADDAAAPPANAAEDVVAPQVSSPAEDGSGGTGASSPPREATEDAQSPSTPTTQPTVSAEDAQVEPPPRQPEPSQSSADAG